MTMTAHIACVKCSKKLDNPKWCAKCNSAAYCSKTCQKDDWKTHKKLCPQLAAKRADSQPVTMHNFDDIEALEVNIDKPFCQLKLDTWMYGRSKEDVYKLLIDSFRIRKMDEYRLLKVTEIVDTDPEVTDGMSAFKDYITTAMDKKLLPADFTAADIKKSIEYSLDASNWSNLQDLWLEKEHYTMRYGGQYMLIQMTLFAWQVLGSLDGDDAEYEEVLETMLGGEVEM